MKMSRTVRAARSVTCFLPLAGILFHAVPALPAQAAADQPPRLRLSDAFKPSHYNVELTLSPLEETFEGRIEIELVVRGSPSTLWLNGSDLVINDAIVLQGAQRIKTEALVGNENFIGLRLERAISPGRARINIGYRGKLSATDSAGIFRRKIGDDWYLFSQFEPLDARRAFPCFDEPCFKVPWQLTLRVKSGLIAISNTPIVSESADTNDMKQVRIAETKPLPSYLVALAVGPFEVVEAGRAGIKKTPVRIITPRGRAAEAQYAAHATPQILTLLEEYFGIPYPYEKLDHVAMPQLSVFSAMENAGMVTFMESILLARPEHVTPTFERDYASICAHELSHQWFGDLVTMKWWDDLWLNEAFASWLNPKIVNRWKPKWNVKLDNIVLRNGSGMNSDSLASARAIRQPIESQHDIENAFDGITYSKGAAILDMFESWCGERTFQDGVRRYLRRHAWGSATSADFITALSEATGRDLRPAFSTFLDKTGLPLATVEMVKSTEGAALRVSQRRYVPLGATGTPGQTWHMPLLMRYSDGLRVRTRRVWLTKPVTAVPLGVAKPSWVLLNAGQVGYYRVNYKGELLSRLMNEGATHLSLAERAGILGDLGALVESGDVPVAEALRLMPRFLADSNRHLVMRSTMMITNLSNLVPESWRSRFALYVNQLHGPLALRLGWLPRPGDDEDTRLLRPVVVALVAATGEDAELIAEARMLAEAWLNNRPSVSPEVVPTILRVAARNGDRTLFERLRGAAQKANDAQEREDLLLALGAFRDPAIARDAFAIILTDTFHPNDAMRILWGANSEAKTASMAYDFMKHNFDALVARSPKELPAYFPFIGRIFSDPQQETDLRDFFKDRIAKFTGGPRNLEQTLETIRLNTARKNAQLISLQSFLEHY